MSLSRSPSPIPGGGWASPGLASPQRGKGKSYQLNGGPNVTWASAQARSNKVNGHPRSANSGFNFIGKHMRKLSGSLPLFNHGGDDDRYAGKERLRGWQPRRQGSYNETINRLGRLMWRMRLRLIILLAALGAVLLFFLTRESIKTVSAETD